MSNTTFEFVAGPIGAWPTEADIFIPATGEYGHFRSRAGNTSLVVTTQCQSWHADDIVAEFRVLLPTPEDGSGTDEQWRIVAVVPTEIIEKLVNGWVSVHLAGKALNEQSLVGTLTGTPGSSRLTGAHLAIVDQLASGWQTVSEAVSDFEQAVEAAG